NIISNLKARLSFGATGNERIPAYRYIGTQGRSYYSSNGVAIYGSSPDNKANPDLKWESTIQYNAGIDIGIVKDRFQFTADVYYKKTTQMLLPAPIPSVTGFSTQWQNLGRIDNKGFELTLISRNISTKDFNWESNFNISFNKNTVKNLGGATIIPVNVAGEIRNIGAVLVGQSLGTGYGYMFDGVYQLSDFTWQNNSDPALSPVLRTYIIKPGVITVAGATVSPGSFRFKDINADGIINDKDLTVISHSAPKFIGGFTNTFRYKNFDFSVFFQGSYGNEVINQSRYLLNGFQSKTNISRDFYYNRW
ncbi:MAG: TonB-dependent receptor, partial [Segetibacter sp.]